MTDLREAAQQALEALIHMCHNTFAQKGYDGQRVQNAIDGLEAALAQQEQEQEPVAWQYKKEGGGIFVSDQCPADVEVWNDIEWSKPLFTTPPRREWQSLTDEEMHGLYRRAGLEAYYPRDGVVQYEYERRLDAYARAVEAALRSKNHD
jgi:hypothetical protein